MRNEASIAKKSAPHETIRFLRACYEADNREMAVSNLLHKSIRHLAFMQGEEHLLCDMLTRTPVNREQAIVAQKEAHLQQREKSLLYCAFPIIGRLHEGQSKPRTLCAPLLFYPASLIIDDNAAFIEVDLSQQRVNAPILSSILAQGKAADAELDELLTNLPQAPLKRDNVQLLISLLHEVVPNFDAWALAEFPRLHSEKQVRQVVRDAEAYANGLTCLPACALGLVPNSPETRGVLYELEELAKGEHFSRALAAAMDAGIASKSQRRAPTKHRVPTVLSRSQEQVLKSAAVAPLSLVIGPPGTGKSYTIAAAAIDHLSRGESVLIACRTHQAINVIGEMIDRLLGPNQCVIRGGPGHNQPELKKFLEQILQGIRSKIRTDHSTASGDARRSARELKSLERRIANLEAAIARQLRAERRWGELTSANYRGFVARTLAGWRLRWLENSLRDQLPIWERIAQYQGALRESDSLTRELLKEGIEQRIAASLKAHRQDLTTFLKSLRSRSSTRQQKLFSEVDSGVLFGAFPIWLTSISEASRIVPLQRELFDVAIVDEATQCDMASCLPIFQRATRAVVVGDPQQLRHVSFLSNERLDHLGDAFGLSESQRQQFHYRKKSILDLLNERIESQDHVHFLDEHFRSLPQIIRFSNEQFYGESLAVMRKSPETEVTRCVVPIFVPNGKRLDGKNELEASVLVDTLAQLIDSQKNLASHVCQSIGVLSPFRDQVDLLTKLLEERLPLSAFERHRLRVGTAHAFQGDERDVMFLSLAIDVDFHSASLRFLENPNLLNVTVTRARHLQYVFHSISAEQLPAKSLLRKYFYSVDQQNARIEPPAHVVADRFLNEVRSQLNERGLQTWPEYELAGQRIDLVVGRAGATLGVDLIGYPGQYGAVLDLERYRILQRAGFPLFPLPYSKWQQAPDDCLAAIESLFAPASSDSAV